MQNIGLNSAVTAFLDEQNHPFRKEIEALRTCILLAENGLEENVKWNGPNYAYQGADCITMRIQPPKKVQLIFHRGARKKEQPAKKLIADGFELLEWKENDRAIATFHSLAEIENHYPAITSIVRGWVKAAAGS